MYNCIFEYVNIEAKWTIKIAQFGLMSASKVFEKKTFIKNQSLFQGFQTKNST